MRSILRDSARAVVPRWLRGYRHLRHARRKLLNLAPIGSSYSTAFKATWESGAFATAQRESEITRFLEWVETCAPRYACEIGTSMGGTFFLLSRACPPDATLITIDRDMPLERKLIYRTLGKPGQSLIPIRGDSRDTATHGKVMRKLGKHHLGLLFIDGDHSYEGVSQDFRIYSPLVEPGGLIVFHDIVPDQYARHGTKSLKTSGDVPVFWNEVKQQYPSREFVTDPEQNAYGIGVVQF